MQGARAVLTGLVAAVAMPDCMHGNMPVVTDPRACADHSIAVEVEACRPFLVGAPWF